jgi:competence CoiA-like predicted nuclease
MYINGTEDVVQRMQYMEQQALFKMKEAKYHLHLPTWESMMQLAYKKKEDVARFLIPEIRIPSSGWWYRPFLKSLPTGSMDKNFSTWG